MEPEPLAADSLKGTSIESSLNDTNAQDGAQSMRTTAAKLLSIQDEGYPNSPILSGSSSQFLFKPPSLGHYNSWIRQKSTDLIKILQNLGCPVTDVCAKYAADSFIHLLKTNTKTDEPKRPRNSFFLFRSDYKMHCSTTDVDEISISQNAASVWKNLPDEDKAEYVKRARIEDAIHKYLYPNYNFRPQKKQFKEENGSILGCN